MAEISGFFPSTTENPRKYGNTWVNQLLDRVISDGVYASPDGTPSNDLQVLANLGMTLTVKAGQGRFRAGDETFTYKNDSDLTITLEPSGTVNRVDYIVVRVDRNENVKRVFVMKKTGDLVTGAEPTLLNNAYQKEYLLAKISVKVGDMTILQKAISDRRGIETPWITSLIQQVDTSTLMAQFDNAFWGWYDNVTKNISGTIMITQRTAQYSTQRENEQTITIPSTLLYEYGDMLTVYIEGVRRNDYTISSDFKTITLKIALPKIGTKVDFDVIKNIDATEAKDYVSRLVNAENNIELFKQTDDIGGTKITVKTNLITELLNLGVGIHTFYSPEGMINNPKSTGHFRGIFFRTGDDYGWMLLVSDLGDLYFNHYVNKSWLGWKLVYESSPTMLNKSVGVLFASATTVTPTKKLSACRNGWCLIWSAYVDGAAQDARWYSTFIPKTTGTGTTPNGDIYYFTIPYNFDDTTGEISSCAKRLIISDSQIKGSDGNAKGNNVNMCYRGCIEY